MPSEGRQRPAAASAEGAGTVLVRDSAGNRHPFLRGMVTHDLVQRGLSFDDAYAAARSIRDRIADREEITTSELKAVIETQLAEMYDAERLAQLRPGSVPAEPVLEVVYHGERQPFSRGLLARSLQAAGVDLDRAYRLVTELQGRLLRERVQALGSDEVARRVGELLEEREGTAAAVRYRLVRRIHRLPRPLVIYLGGATGTGKSTLALEIAPLLRIYRITATDTIRQVMRMLFSSAILPALHASSFELAAGDLPGLEPGGDEADRGDLLTATFNEQAVRVAVGVRAVVERAIVENMSVVVEGVHLVPPLVPFADLEGAVHQVSLMLTTLTEETHRSRFLARSRTSPRSAERYVRNFASIRSLQEHLTDQAETHEIPLFDTSEGDTALPRALRLVTGLLQEKLPWLGRPDEAVAPRELVPTLLVAVDGMADHPTRALGGRTPLAAANLPTFDRLAREGRSGLADPVAPGVVPDTASGTLALLGQSPLAMKRGPVEALGAGVDLEPEDVALRGNLASLAPDGRLIDRRAGRIRGETAQLAAALDRMHVPGGEFEGVEVRVLPSTEHRLSIVLRGADLSSAIEGSDPGDGAPPGPPLTPRPLNPRDEVAVRTARLLALFEEAAQRLLEEHPVNAERRARGLPPANVVLTRGAGRVHRLMPLEQQGLPLRAACISGDRTILGLAAWLGAETLTSERMTANLDTDLDAKLTAALEALSTHDLVVLHVKGADIAAHDQRPDLKVAFLERVDRALGWLLEQHPGPLRVAVASDHATLSEGGQHAADPVPVVIWGQGIEPDRVRAFDEKSVAAGALRRFPLQLLLSRLYEG